VEQIIETLKSADNEATRSPYWTIVDPYRQLFELGDRGIHTVASMISGLFFSREDAENYLRATRYNFSKHARVYCHSGHHSKKYDNFCKSLSL